MVAGVWIGRLFARDQDFGEHWFDNWDEREEKEKQFGVGDASELLIVVPSRFTQGPKFCIQCENSFEKWLCPECQRPANVRDGPCYSDEAKTLFWTDVLKSLKVSTETLAANAKD